MPADKYPSFAALATHEKEGRDYRIRLHCRGSRIVIVAPHGGNIEPGTSKIAAEIAAEEYSLYCFEGLRKKSRELHITSTNFDELKCRQLVEASQIVIGVHGRADKENDRQTVWLGDLDKSLRDAVKEALKHAGFKATTDHNLKGENAENICNKGLTGKGVQLELPKTLRDELAEKSATFERIR